MDDVTVNKQEYESLKRQAAAWREAIGDTDSGVVFNAVRDNKGDGIEADILANKLRAIVDRDE